MRDRSRNGGPPRVALPASNSIRDINRGRIISLVRRHPGATRIELSRETGLSKATISNLVEALLDEGFLAEEQPGGGRRRNSGLWLSLKVGVAVGVELSPDECRAVLADVDVHPLRQVQRPLSSTRVEEVVAAIVATVEELLAGCDRRCLGLAVAVPGPADAPGETVAFSDSLGWTDVPLARLLAERLPFPVMLINRPRAGVLGEYCYGAGQGADDLIYVSVTSGVSAGIVLGGQLFTGARGYGGELGHTSVLADGPECVCGNRGCLEAVASLPAIIRAIEARLQAGEPSALCAAWQQAGRLADRAVIAAARDGDALALDEIRKASRLVGIGVANLINLFNPARVIVGGRLAEAGEVVLNSVREVAQRRAYPISYAGVKIVRSELGADAVCIGACALVIDGFLDRMPATGLAMPAPWRQEMAQRAAMTSRERMLAALRSQDVDYVPCCPGWWWGAAPKEEAFPFKDDEERVAFSRELGVDAIIFFGLPPAPVAMRSWVEARPGEPYPRLHSEIDTPKGALHAIIRKTDDYPDDCVPLYSDWVVSRLVKPWVETLEDVERLATVFLPPAGAQLREAQERYRRLQGVAERHQVLLVGDGGMSMDPVIFLMGAQQGVLASADHPEVVSALLDVVHANHRKRLETLLDWGVPAVIRNGWYDSTDFWSRNQFERWVMPELRRTIEMAHQAGAAYVYQMCTGIRPLLPLLAALPYDCQLEPEPVLGRFDMAEIRAALPGKSVWGGVSAPVHIGEGNPAEVRAAVRAAFAAFGRRGFILKAVPSIRRHWPWENVLAMVEEWKKLR